MFKYLVNQVILDDNYHRVYAHNGVVLNCSCHKDLAIKPDSTWMCKFTSRRGNETMFITMQEAEAKFIALCEDIGRDW